MHTEVFTSVCMQLGIPTAHKAVLPTKSFQIYFQEAKKAFPAQSADFLTWHAKSNLLLDLKERLLPKLIEWHDTEASLYYEDPVLIKTGQPDNTVFLLSEGNEPIGPRII